MDKVEKIVDMMNCAPKSVKFKDLVKVFNTKVHL